MTKKYFLSAISICLMVSLFIVMIIGIINSKLLNPLMTRIIIISFIILTIILIKLYLSKNHRRYNAGALITIVLNLVLAFQIIDMNNSYSYIENLVSNSYEYNTYELYVQKSNTTYSKIDKLKGKTIGLLENNRDNVIAYIDNLVDVKYRTYHNLDELFTAIKDGEIQAFIISDQNKNELEKNKNKSKIRMIYTNRIKKEL